jgi:hypothetical protein
MPEFREHPAHWPSYIARRVVDPRCKCGHARSEHHAEMGCRNEHRYIERTPSWTTGAQTAIDRGMIECSCRRYRPDRDRYTQEQWEWMREDGLL